MGHQSSFHPKHSDLSFGRGLVDFDSDYLIAWRAAQLTDGREAQLVSGT